MEGLDNVDKAASFSAVAARRSTRSLGNQYEPPHFSPFKSLNPRQQSQFSVAILPIALGKYKSFLDVPPATMAGIGPQTNRPQIDGMSFEEILALARKQPVKVDAAHQL